MSHPHRALLDIAAGREVAEVSDPEALLRSASEHGMLGLLWSEVTRGAVAVPQEQTLQLAASDVGRRDRRQMLLVALQRAIEILADRDIDIATFKGIALEHRWYDRAGERPCLDVDVLLSPRDLHRFGEAVDALDPSFHPRRGLDARIAAGRQQAATVSLHGAMIDLHAEVPKLQVPSRGARLVWAHRTRVQLDDRLVPALGAEAELFALLTSLLKDRFARLITYVDVANVIERSDIEWDAVRRMAAADELDGLVRRAVHTVFRTLDRSAPVLGPAWRRGASIAWPVLSRSGATLIARNPRPRRLLLVPLMIPRRRTEVLRVLVRRALPSKPDIDHLYVGRSVNPLARLVRSRREPGSPR